MIGNLAILWPVVVQAALTLAIYPVLLRRRIAAVRGGAAIECFRVTGNEPEGSATAVRNLANQFELPVLFYAVCLALYVTNGANWLAVALAWVFAASRVAHAAVHLRTNRLRPRMRLFLVGYAAVALMWLLFALHLAGIA